MSAELMHFVQLLWTGFAVAEQQVGSRLDAPQPKMLLQMGTGFGLSHPPLMDRPVMARLIMAVRHCFVSSNHRMSQTQPVSSDILYQKLFSLFSLLDFAKIVEV